MAPHAPQRSSRPGKAVALLCRLATRAVLATLTLIAIGVSLVSAQQTYPNRPIEFIIPFPPGGPADAAVRIIQPHMQAALGVPISPQNKAGGGGALAADYVAKSKPDGYTVFAATNAPVTIGPAVQDLSYKPTDFTPVGEYMVDVSMLVAKAGGPWKTLDEFIADAKKNPGKYSYGSAGLGTVSFFMFEMVKAAYGLDVTHVPFQGGGPVKNAIMGGHIAVASSGLNSFAPLIKSGDLTGLVTSASKRLAAFPTIPTIAEKGAPDASLNIWMALFVPAKAPRDVVDKLSRALEKTMKDPSVIAAADKAGLIAEFHDSDTVRKRVETEHATVKKVVDKLGLKNK